MNYDPTDARRILGPYPELLEYWEFEMNRPDRDYEYGPGGVERMHSPVYLREVVRQHRWITEGPGDYVDPKVKQEIEELLDTAPPWLREARDEDVSDPWTRAMSCGAYFAKRWYNPGHVRNAVWHALNPRSPDSPEEQHMRELGEAFRAGGEIVVTEIDTGKATRLDGPAKRFGSAPHG